MFTGIVEETGHVRRMEQKSGGARMEIEAVLVLEGTNPGHSVAVNGVCLTVETVASGRFSAFLSGETLEKTTLCDARPGDDVNLERALTFGGRLGGHLVSGHVEAIGRIEVLKKEGESCLLEVSSPPAFEPFLIEKGSIAIDGVSLTMVEAVAGRIKVALIPETFEKTTFRLKTPGDFVNLEPDLILKYVMSTVLQLTDPGETGSITMEKLKEAGFIAD